MDILPLIGLILGVLGLVSTIWWEWPTAALIQNATVIVWILAYIYK
jgi:hypothetical protein